MASRLPIWYGQPRGAGLASLSIIESSDQEVEDQGFVGQLGDRLFSWIDDTQGVFVGLVLPLAVLAITATLTAPEAPLAAAFLAFGAALWLAVGGVSAWLVAIKDDDAPAWASYVVSGLTGLGRLILIMFVVASVVAVFAALATLLMAAAAEKS